MGLTMALFEKILIDACKVFIGLSAWEYGFSYLDCFEDSQVFDLGLHKCVVDVALPLFFVWLDASHKVVRAL